MLYDEMEKRIGDYVIEFVEAIHDAVEEAFEACKDEAN